MPASIFGNYHTILRLTSATSANDGNTSSALGRAVLAWNTTKAYRSTAYLPSPDDKNNNEACTDSGSGASEGVTAVTTACTCNHLTKLSCQHTSSVTRRTMPFGKNPQHTTLLSALSQAQSVPRAFVCTKPQCGRRHFWKACSFSLAL